MNGTGIEFVGGPKCGEVRHVQALPDSVQLTYEPRIGQTWIADYRRTKQKSRDGFIRYEFAGMRKVVHSSAI